MHVLRKQDDCDGVVPAMASDAVAREDRRAVEMRGFVVRANDDIIDIRLLDISYNGCSVETVVEFEPGEKVMLSILGRGAVRSVVRWYDGRRAGLEFVNERIRRRERATRLAVAGEAQLRRSGRLHFRVRVFDLSLRGCRLEFIDRPTMGERVWIKFDALEALESEVAWVAGSEVGVNFRHALHPAVFDLLVHRLGGSIS